MRIVSLVPSHTESLHDLGAANDVVGRTRFCIAPSPWVDSIPHVGGTKDASLEKILALKPDLVVADKDENPRALVESLQDAGVDVLWSEIDTVRDAADFLETLGRRIGRDEAGAEAAKDITEVLGEAGRAVRDARARGQGAVPVFCPIWYDPWMTFDATAYPSDILQAVGLVNAFYDHAGPKYFEVAPGDVADSSALFTLLPTEPYPFHKHRNRVVTADLGPAGAEGHVRGVDGEALTWFGTRTVAGIKHFMAVAEDLRVAAGRF